MKRKLLIKVGTFVFALFAVFMLSATADARIDNTIVTISHDGGKSTAVIGKKYSNYSYVYPTAEAFGSTYRYSTNFVYEPFVVRDVYDWFWVEEHDKKDFLSYVAVVFKAEKLLNAPVVSYSNVLELQPGSSAVSNIVNGSSSSFTYSESATKSYSFSQSFGTKLSGGVKLDDIISLGAEYSSNTTVSASVSNTVGHSITYSASSSNSFPLTIQNTSNELKYYRYEGRCDFEVYVIMVFKVEYKEEVIEVSKSWGKGEYSHNYTLTGYILQEQNYYFKEITPTYREGWFEYERIPGDLFAFKQNVYNEPNVVYVNYY